MKSLIVQGDVFLTECKIPKEAKNKKGHVLAEGEVTGHSHAVAEKELASLYEHNGILYMRASDNVTIRHEEHKPVSVPAGEWKVFMRCNINHGLSKTPEHQAWQDAKRRCFNINNPRYRRYGGRGITMCEKWKNDFLAFYYDMGPRPKGYSLERINNNGNYEPNNCKWATMNEQLKNRQVFRDRRGKYAIYVS